MWNCGMNQCSEYDSRVVHFDVEVWYPYTAAFCSHLHCCFCQLTCWSMWSGLLQSVLWGALSSAVRHQKLGWNLFAPIKQSAIWTFSRAASTQSSSPSPHHQHWTNQNKIQFINYCFTTGDREHICVCISINNWYCFVCFRHTFSSSSCLDGQNNFVNTLYIEIIKDT